MSESIVQVNEEATSADLKVLVRKTVEETLNALLDEEDALLANAARYARSEGRQAYRSGHYERKLLATSGEVTVKRHELKVLSFQTAIIERYRRGESSVEEAMVEMYLAGVSTRRMQDITEILWGKSVSAATVSNLNKSVLERIEEWRNRPLGGKAYPYLYVDGIYQSINWGGEARECGCSCGDWRGGGRTSGDFRRRRRHE